MNSSDDQDSTLFFAAGLLNLTFLLGGLFSGVRSEVKVVGPTLPARPPDCQIEVLQEVKPERPFEIVAQIDVYVRRNKVTRGRQGVFEEALPELKKQACRVGADGVKVLRQTVSHSGEFKLLYVKSEAFHYTGSPPVSREGPEKPEESQRRFLAGALNCDIARNSGVDLCRLVPFGSLSFLGMERPCRVL